MPALLLILLILVEIAGFAAVGRILGVLGTLALAVASTALGLAVIRAQGFALRTRLQAALARDEPPVAALVDGLGLALAALLLVIPGFVSSAAGLVMLIPALRRRLVGALLGWLRGHGRVSLWPGGVTIIEGEWREVGPDTDGSAPDRDRFLN